MTIYSSTEKCPHTKSRSKYRSNGHKDINLNFCIFSLLITTIIYLFIFKLIERLVTLEKDLNFNFEENFDFIRKVYLQLTEMMR